MKVLVAVDGSQYGLSAVDEAARMPWPQGSEVKIITAIEMPTPVTVGTLPMPDNYYAEWEKALEDQATANTTNAVARFNEKGCSGLANCFSQIGAGEFGGAKGAAEGQDLPLAAA